MSPYTDALRAVCSSTAITLDDSLKELEAISTVRCIKIDPRDKSVTFANLPFSVTREEDRVEVRVEYSQLKQSLDVPARCTLDRLRTPFGHVVCWDDLEHMGMDSMHALPGFQLRRGTTLRGPVLLYNTASKPVGAFTVSAVQEASEEDCTRMAEEIVWLDARDVLEVQLEEYRNTKERIEEMKRRGALQGVQIVHVCPK